MHTCSANPFLLVLCCAILTHQENGPMYPNMWVFVRDVDPQTCTQKLEVLAFYEPRNQAESRRICCVQSKN